jgi:hypothetical protein
MDIKTIEINEFCDKYATQNLSWVQFLVTNEQLKALKDNKKMDYINIQINGQK